MCGEVAVLTLTEFTFCEYLYNTFAEVRPLIRGRNAIPLLHEYPLQGRSPVQLAMRLDGLLHKKIRPQWVRTSPVATLFVDDYVPMLEADRQNLDRHWAAMKQAQWIPEQAPNSRYGRDLDGLELTIWMINDFFHLMDTDSHIDRGLREFNRQRRQTIVLPEGW